MATQDKTEKQELEFTAKLDCRYRDALEQLLFFNANQQRVYSGAVSMVERYGAPHISTENDRLWVTFDSGIDAQSLFIVDRARADSPLLGFVVYTREVDALVVLIMAVREDCAYSGDAPDKALFRHLLAKMLEIARRVKGVATLKLFFSDPPLVISVRKQK
jgi:hypothetical protein